jgi:hypothetical protein
MIKRLLLLAVLAMAIVPAVPADVPDPPCLPGCDITLSAN